MTNKKEDIDVKLIKHIQEGLPVTKTPYKDIGQALGMSEEEVIQRLQKLLESGKVRRLAASIWEYNVFTMIHGYTDAECEAVIQAIKKKTGLNDYVILYSEKEFKKVGVRI